MTPSPHVQLVRAVEAAMDALVAKVVDTVFEQVSAYDASTDPRLHSLVTRHAEAILRSFARNALEGPEGAVHVEEFRLSRADANVFLDQEGATLTDLLQGYRVGQLALWQGVLALAEPSAKLRQAALSLVAPMMRTADAASTAAAQAYLEASQYRQAQSDRARRDLLEDLLARREPASGPAQAVLRAAGLDAGASLVVLAATPVGTPHSEASLQEAAAVLAARRTRAAIGLTVLRHDEIIVIVPVRERSLRGVLDALESASADLAAKGLRMAAGVSNVHVGLAKVPDAYAEAVVARGALGADGGVVALPTLSAFDYVVLQADQTARGMIRPQVRRFVEEDLARDGGLIETLVAYAAADLNAKTAAARLHLHVNTAYYRLERIAEKTGSDLRSFSDVVDLMLAVRLLAPEAVPRIAARD